LSISETAGGISKRWTFMFTLDGKQREAGFGPVAMVSLAQARKRAAEWRDLVALG
jgi:hypothetical protein